MNETCGSESSEPLDQYGRPVDIESILEKFIENQPLTDCDHDELNRAKGINWKVVHRKKDARREQKELREVRIRVAQAENEALLEWTKITSSPHRSKQLLIEDYFDPLAILLDPKHEDYHAVKYLIKNL